MNRIVLASLAGAMALTPQVALADVPAPVQSMIDAAIAEGDADTVRSVFALAKKTNPEDAAALDAMLADFEAKEAEKAAAAAAAEEAEMRNAGLLDNWSGQGQLGAFRSTGNSSNTGITAGLALEKTGIKWHHKLTGLADYQRTNGVTTREQFIVAYEANYDISDRIYAYGLAQYERDTFQGYNARYTASGGLGYRVIVEEDMQLNVKAGPAYRQTEFVDGTSSSSIAGLAALDFDWQISDNLRLTEDAAAYIESGNNTFVSTTGLVAGLGGGLSASLSYTIEHETDPPLGAVKTDTLTRASLIYDF
jgi:putative salt-induced outer membrane protein